MPDGLVNQNDLKKAKARYEYFGFGVQSTFNRPPNKEFVAKQVINNS